jgi:hypothetical protein
LRLNAASLRSGIAGLRDQMIDTNDATEVLAAGGLAHANEINQELAGKVQLLQARLHDLQPEIDSVTAKHRDEGAAARETAGSLDRYTAATEAGTNASSALATLTDDAKKALNDLQSALLQAAGGNIAYQQSIISRDEAQQRSNDSSFEAFGAQLRYNQAVIDFGPDSEQARVAQGELTQAQRDNTSAQLELQQANLNVGQSTIALKDNEQQLLDAITGGKGTKDDQLAALDAEIAKLKGLQGDYPATASSLDPYLAQLDVLRAKIEGTPTGVQPPTIFPIEIAASFTGSNTLSALAALGGGDALVPLANFLNSLPKTAVGGVFTSPQARMFAEAGPEAVLPLNDPRRSWEIIQQTGLVAAAPAAAGSSLAGTTINYHGPLDDPVARTRGILADLRSVGRLATL